VGRQIVRVNGVDLCVEAFGDAGDPAILLIGGAGASMDWWDEEFCRRLAAGSRYIVRYDHRDTGESVVFPPGAPAYTQDDLVEDAVGVLDACGVPVAHVVGISMGGDIAQRLGVLHPDRVASLTLMATSPGPVPDLPPTAEHLRAHLAEAPDVDLSDPETAIAHLVAQERLFAGELPFDEVRVRRTAARVVHRSVDLAASLTNHMLAEAGAPVRGRLGEIVAPALVVHGTADPLFPLGHGAALAAEIPGARLLPVPGMGHHVPPPSVWDLVVPAILEHTDGDWERQADLLAARSLAAGEPTRWFEQLYTVGRSGAVQMPWARGHPHPLLRRWTDERAPHGTGRRAVVVGCGLGADAEHVAALGFSTVAFDISPTAVDVARARFPRSPVRYVVADLLDLPPDWVATFDLVVEVYTVQALPDPPRRRAIGEVAGLVAPGGALVVVAAAHDEDRARPGGPPWPLTRAEIDAFATRGLTAVDVERVAGRGDPAVHRWLAEFRKG
jgi:pimeloyl-ACP methyl ester carboxylesterase/SAM-dependent methyltransferase